MTNTLPETTRQILALIGAPALMLLGAHHPRANTWGFCAERTGLSLSLLDAPRGIDRLTINPSGKPDHYNLECWGGRELISHLPGVYADNLLGAIAYHTGVELA